MMDIEQRWVLVCTGEGGGVASGDGADGYDRLLRLAKEFVSRPTFNAADCQVGLYLTPLLGEMSNANFLRPGQVKKWASTAAKRRERKSSTA